jgi:hypothetical protein
MSTPYHQTKNPSTLTPFEQQIHDFRQQGLTWSEIAQKLGKGTRKSLACNYVTIKHKLATAAERVKT